MDRIFGTALLVIGAAFFPPASASAADPMGPGPIPPPLIIAANPLRHAPPRAMSVEPTASPLRIAEPADERSDLLEQVARQADRQTQHGCELAGRGAYFAARVEFLGALKLISDGLDTQQKTDMHGRALTAALTAVREADDFLPGGPRLEADVDLSGIIAAHTTPVLKGTTEHVTSMTALRSYFTYAQEQFSAAVGREVAGSMALQSLGKLHAALAQKKSGPVAAAESKAMVYYQAAMLVYPENFMAANELGVLLARCGAMVEARAMLEHSLSTCRTSAACHNLAVVYGQLGQTALARRAWEDAASLARLEAARRKAALGTATDGVLWTDPQTFAQTSTGTPGGAGAMPRPAAGPSGKGAEPSPSAKAATSPTMAERVGWKSAAAPDRQ
jgi:hypothetical protein